jgi:hypothetical protein
MLTSYSWVVATDNTLQYTYTHDGEALCTHFTTDCDIIRLHDARVARCGVPDSGQYACDPYRGRTEYEDE